ASFANGRRALGPAARPARGGAGGHPAPRPGRAAWVRGPGGGGGGRPPLGRVQRGADPASQASWRRGRRSLRGQPTRSPGAPRADGRRWLPPVRSRLRPVGRIDVGRGSEQNSIVNANRPPVVRVETSVMRNAVLAVLGMLVLATPAAAAGAKPVGSPQFAAPPAPRATPPVFAASSPFVVATQPFAASSSVSAPLPPSVRGVSPDHLRWRRAPIFVGAPAAAPQVIVVQQQVPVYYADTTPAPVCSPGYWSYRWVPYTTTQTAWAQGAWGRDGTWTASRWESGPYSAGYYEPLWTPGC